ncbi:MAG: branched-chain amino acid aminotransferase [Gemmataceae bacterium]
MQSILFRLWNDDQGALITAEYLFVSVILVIGLVVGLTNVRNAINAELTELGNAFLALSQGYSITGAAGPGGSIDGTTVIDTPGFTMPTIPQPGIPSIIDAIP